MKIEFSLYHLKGVIVIFCLFSSTLIAVEDRVLGKQTQPHSTRGNERINNPQSLAVQYYNLGIEADRKGNKLEAIKNLMLAVDLFVQAGERKNQVIASLYLSQLYIETGLVAKLEPILTQVIFLARSENFSRELGIARELLGDLNLRLNRYAEAIEQYKISLEIERATSPLISISQAYYKRAKAYQKEKIATSQPSETFRLNNQIDQDLKEGYDRAIEAIKLSQTSYQKINSRLNTFKNYKNRLTTKQFTQYKKETIALITNLPETSFKASSLIGLAKISPNSEALQLLSQSSEIAEKIGDHYTESLAKENLGAVYLERNDLDRAKDYTESAALIAQAIPSPQREFYQFWQLGKIELALGNRETAIAAYSLALSKLRSRHSQLAFGPDLLFHLRDDARTFLREYITLLLESNQPKEAIEVLRILKLAEFQAYFNDPCFDLEVSSRASSLDSNSATIHTFVSIDRLYLILEYQNKYTLRFVNISQSELEERVTRYMRSEIAVAIGDDYVATAKSLYNILIRPIAARLPPSVEALKISGDGILRILSWDSLMDDRGNFLIEKYPVVGVTGLPAQAHRKKSGEKVIFALSEATQTSPLKYAELEADAIDKISPARLFLGKDFTAARLKSAIANQGNIRFHIVTHGSFNGSARRSYLQTFDRPIFLVEFKSMLLNALDPIELIVLSGCETALGNDQSPLGFSGVSARAKIPYVLGTLWTIPDNEATVKFMENFYLALSEAKTVERSKQFAQTESIKAGENPYIWGGITLIVN